MAKIDSGNRHEFAFYLPELSQLISSASNCEVITIANQDVVHRISHIVRMEPGHACVVFDHERQARLVLQQYVGKKSIIFLVSGTTLLAKLTPAITVLLPLLKKDDFEAALYGLVEMGATTIQPVITHKVQRTWGKDKELERINKIMIAAAEQSKHYALPAVHDPLPFEKVLTLPDGAKIYFDPAGDELWHVMTNLRTKKPSELFIMIGPEGDLTDAEKKQLKDSGFIFCALTPTVLRAVQAVQLGLGIMRSLF